MPRPYKFKVGDLITHPIGGIGLILKVYRNRKRDSFGNKYKIFIKNHRDDKSFMSVILYSEILCYKVKV